MTAFIDFNKLRSLLMELAELIIIQLLIENDSKMSQRS